MLLGVAEAWILAAVLAVVAPLPPAGSSRRASRSPIDVLTDASDRMAEGDLWRARTSVADDEVGRLADSFNVMADADRDHRHDAQRRFVADAAHEIGTPLTALQADLELADATSDASEEGRLIDRALLQVRRLESLSANLLRLSRIEAGDRVPDLERLDLNDVARQTADATASRAEQAGLEFTLELAHGDLPVVADRDQLQVAVENLLENAVKFTPAHGTVYLGTRRSGDRAVLWVSDTGIGIPLQSRTRSSSVSTARATWPTTREAGSVWPS